LACAQSIELHSARQILQDGAVSKGGVIGRFRAVVSIVHGLVGAVAAVAGGWHLVGVVRGIPGLTLAERAQVAWVEVSLASIVLLPGLLMVASARPMFREESRAFRSAAAAGFVLGVALAGLVVLFGGRLAAELLVLLAADMVLLGVFAIARKRVAAGPA